MTARKGLVLDTNILVRAVFGHRVQHILEKYGDTTSFYSPDFSYQEALRYVPLIAAKRGLDTKIRLAFLDQTAQIVEQIDRALYVGVEKAARERIELRDPDDWPVVAVALLLKLPIWTEDQDFFGTGIATWTTDRVELYLQEL